MRRRTQPTSSANRPAVLADRQRRERAGRHLCRSMGWRARRCDRPAGCPRRIGGGDGGGRRCGRPSSLGLRCAAAAAATTAGIMIAAATAPSAAAVAAAPAPAATTAAASVDQQPRLRLLLRRLLAAVERGDAAAFAAGLETAASDAAADLVAGLFAPTLALWRSAPAIAALSDRPYRAVVAAAAYLAVPYDASAGPHPSAAPLTGADFERATPMARTHAVLLELQRLRRPVAEAAAAAAQRRACDSLFSLPLLANDTGAILCAILLRATQQTDAGAVAEALLVADDPLCTPAASSELTAASPVLRILRIVACNVPAAAAAMAARLVRVCVQRRGERAGRAVALLLALCDLMPQLAAASRATLARSPALVGPAVELLLRHGDGDVDFAIGLLCDPDMGPAFARFMQSPAIAAGMLRDRLMAHWVTVADGAATASCTLDAVYACATLLRLYSGLAGVAELALTESEVAACLDAVLWTRRVRLQLDPTSPVHDSVEYAMKQALCFILACPKLTGYECLQQRQVPFLEWARDLTRADWTGSTAEPGPGHRSAGEMSLLVTVMLRTDQLAALTELVRNTLAMPVSLHGDSVRAVGSLLLQHAFTAQLVTMHALRAPPTPGLCANHGGYLPIHCIYYLLRCGHLSDGPSTALLAREWVLQQLWQCREPLHPLAVALIEAYAAATLGPTAGAASTALAVPGGGEAQQLGPSQATTLPGLTAQHILAAFRCGSGNAPGAPLAVRVLLLHYALHYNALAQSVREAGRSELERATPHRPYRPTPVAFSTDLFDTIPVAELLCQARRCRGLAIIVPALMRYCMQQLPHLLDPIVLLQSDALRVSADPSSPACARAGQRSTPIRCALSAMLGDAEMDAAASAAPAGLPLAPTVVRRLFDGADYADPVATVRLSLALELLLTLAPDELEPFLDAIIGVLFVALLRAGAAAPLLHMRVFCTLWQRLAARSPRQILAQTVSASIRARDAAHGGLSHADIVADPLLVLRCHRTMFQYAPFVWILLHLLRTYTTEARLSLAERLRADSARSPLHASELAELHDTLLCVQDAAIVQLLLEACQPAADVVAAPDPYALFDATQHEAQLLLCSHIHQVFIANPAVCKLVHTQGYPRAMLPLTCRAISSMHICLDLIPELVAHKDAQVVAFAVHLAAELCLSHPIAKADAAARQAIAQLKRIAEPPRSAAECCRHIAFWLDLLPALERFCIALPPLSDECLALLLAVSSATPESPACLGDAGESTAAPMYALDRAIDATVARIAESLCQTQMIA